MKVVVALLLVAAVGCAVAIDADAAKRQFADYKQTYGRTYTGAEDAHRFACFTENLKLIDERNAKGAEMNGVNQFTDLCPAEFAKYYLGYKASNTTQKASPAPLYQPHELAPMGSSVDWRTKGAVTPVKNQGQCGSCWSFSTTGNVEGQWFLANGNLVSFSEEELVQCSASAGNQGCNGGLMDDAFEWIVSNGGIDTEADYPYTSGGGITGTCDNAKLANKVGKLTGHTDLPHNEAQMMTWVSTGGPLSIAVDALSWQTYIGGIKKYCFGRTLDHGVLIVGFDTTNSPPYWIVKNSWGASWGESGYIRLEYGTNQCGLTEAPSTSIAAKQ
jgi:C1A family cysteine protease